MLPSMCPKRLVQAFGLLLLASCASPLRGGADHVVYDTSTGTATDLAAMCAELATYDVVFLGEEHDNDVGHRLQLETLERLFELRGEVVLAMEQFEADVQGPLDLYLAGAIDERTFLESSRPWGNYEEHYAPLVECARAHAAPVIAANIPRPLARRVSRQGLASVDGEVYAPWSVWTDEPRYLELFAQAMGREEVDPEDEGLALWFTAQCIKDDKMAQSLVEVAASEPTPRPLIVHICGKFHSDEHLGTASRLARRRPDLRIAVVSMSSRAPLDEAPSADELARGEFFWRVPRQAE